MKKPILLVLSIVFCNIVFSAPIIKAIANGNWNTTSTWSLNRLPKVGDTIIIPASKTVTINDDESFNGFVYIQVYGRLFFQNNNSTLRVNDPSVIMVYPNALISGSGSASQKIRYNNSIIFDGSDAPIIGPQMASATSNGFTSFAFSALPVKFIGFTLTGQNNNVLIQWSTSEEVNADTYEVERSTNGVTWSAIAYVPATGNSSAVNNYSYTDKNNSAAIVYYRIKEIDLGGKETYTSIKSIRPGASLAKEIKIAGMQNKVLLQFPQQIKGDIAIRFISAGGQVVDQQNIKNPVGQVVLNAKVTGNYIISVSNGQDINTAKPVIL